MTIEATPDPVPDASAEALLERIRQALRLVIDPEVGMNIVDLGLVYAVELRAGEIYVRMTMTSAACPMTEMILDDVYTQLEAVLPESMPMEIELVWEPPWTPAMMSPAARAGFGWSPGLGADAPGGPAPRPADE